jgi:hypothetical protein
MASDERNDSDARNYTSITEDRAMGPAYDPTIPLDRPRIRGVVRDILVAFTISALPLVAFSSLLLGLVFGFRITPDSPIDQSLGSEPSADDGDVIYVNLNATVLTTVSSWSSTMAPLVLPFILTLASFPVAKILIHATENDEHRNPTPYQLALMLRILSNASLSSLWRYITYVFDWRKTRAPITTPLRVMTWILSLGTVLR